jgi:hypothetical protein
MPNYLRYCCTYNVNLCTDQGCLRVWQEAAFRDRFNSTMQNCLVTLYLYIGNISEIVFTTAGTFKIIINVFKRRNVCINYKGGLKGV